jgi:hypothetical protein
MNGIVSLVSELVDLSHQPEEIDLCLRPFGPTITRGFDGGL